MYSNCWWKISYIQWNRHKLSMANGWKNWAFKPQSRQLLYFIIAVEFPLFALSCCYGDSLGKSTESYFAWQHCSNCVTMACLFVHTQQKSPKIASSVCFDSARHHIIQNMITHNCVVAANCIPAILAKTIILLNRKECIVYSPFTDCIA